MFKVYERFTKGNKESQKHENRTSLAISAHHSAVLKDESHFDLVRLTLSLAARNDGMADKVLQRISRSKFARLKLHSSKHLITFPSQRLSFQRDGHFLLGVN